MERAVGWSKTRVLGSETASPTEVAVDATGAPARWSPSCTFTSSANGAAAISAQSDTCGALGWAAGDARASLRNVWALFHRELEGLGGVLPLRHATVRGMPQVAQLRRV